MNTQKRLGADDKHSYLRRQPLLRRQLLKASNVLLRVWDLSRRTGEKVGLATMREAVGPLDTRYPIEYVFSMADQPLIERAVRRLEKRGARAAVIVRVFGLVPAFRSEVERMIGTNIEASNISSF